MCGRQAVIPPRSTSESSSLQCADACCRFLGKVPATPGWQDKRSRPQISLRPLERISSPRFWRSDLIMMKLEGSKSSRWGNFGRRARLGVASLELAAVLPVLTIVLAATADYSRFGTTAMTVANAARCGSGYGCTHPYDTYTQAAFEQQLRQQVINELSTAHGFDVGRASISISRLGVAPDDRIEVTVSYPFRTLIHWGFLPRETTVVRKSALPMIR